MIFECISGKYERVLFLALKTKIHKEFKSKKWNFSGKLDYYNAPEKDL